MILIMVYQTKEMMYYQIMHRKEKEDLKVMMDLKETMDLNRSRTFLDFLNGPLSIIFIN